ncbi:glycosyltransferase [Rhodovarius lipocyclicus]|uniref:glycosyltransferase n=1 Tax=Rhodovarius lipocyclicus TaxID=268410 RepID=UPI0013589488|nr:glycosyltransferase [Rhodovarius lipocyclicus]
MRRARRLVGWTLTAELLPELRKRKEPLLARLDYLLSRIGLRLPRRPSMLRAELGLPDLKKAPKPEAIRLSVSETPVVTVLIPTYGQVDYTLLCLNSLAQFPPETPIEVIVAEDASGDPRIPELRRVAGLRLLEREKNLGFLLSCNDAAKRARGEFIFLLNNDTEVMPGAIDALVRTLRDHPEAGMAGARLLYPDGYQQEAGGIVWQDGSAWNYGHRDDPTKPEYNYLREADYISGAAIMLPLAVWNRMGGFDEHYVPAYCEDSDLAFRLRAAGMKVLYQPEAQVIHYEGVSHGRDVNAGLKAYQVANTAKLHARWAAELAGHFPGGTHVMRARDRAFGSRVTLVMDNNVPEPDRDAGSRTMLAFIQALQATGRIVKFWPTNGYATPGYTRALQQMGVQVFYTPWYGSFRAFIQEQGAEIDEILLSRPHVAEENLALIRQHCSAPVVFYGHDLHHARMRREAEAAQSQTCLREAEEMQARERAVWRAVDLVLYPSEDEAIEVRRLEPGVPASGIVPYALPPTSTAAMTPAGRDGVMFVAGFGHSPNVDAAQWLVREIMPILRAQRPGLRLSLVGSNPTAEVKALADALTEVTGFVSDEELARRYAGTRVVLCPLRFGAGVKMKVVEALHSGVPLVMTTTGAQGLTDVEQACDVTDDPAAFAAAVLRLLEDEALWAARSRSQRAYVEGRFTLAAMSRALEDAFSAAAARAASHPG